MRWLKLLVLAAVLLALLLGALWATSPYILQWGAGQLGPRWGISDIELSADRPGLGGLHINRLAATAGAWQVEATDVDILYLLGKLRLDLSAAPVRSVRIAALKLHQIEPPTVESIVSENKGLTWPFADNPAELWQQVITRVPPATIQQLELVIDAVGFKGRGKAAVTADGLFVEINGIEPAEAANFKLSAQVLPTGDVALDFFDVSQPLAPFVTGTAFVADEAFNLALEFVLRDYPLQLISNILDLPQGSGKVAGNVRSQTVWPLNPAAWPALPVDGSLTVDWQGESSGLTLSGIDARFHGTPVNLSAHLQGKLNWQDPQLDLAFPPGFTVEYADEQILLGPGIAFDLQWDERTSASGKLGATKLQLRENPTIVASAVFSTVAGATRATGKASGQLQLHSLWPVNLDAWQTLPVNGSLDVDWHGDTEEPSKLSTRFTGTSDNLKMAVHGRIMMQDPQLTLVAPPGLEVAYTADRVSIGPDITFDLLWDEKTALRGKLGASKIDFDKKPTLTTSAVFNGEFDSYRATGKLTGEFSQGAESFHGQGTINLGSVPATFSLQFSPDAGGGYLTAKADHNVTRPLMANVLTNWQELYDVTGGQLGLELNSEWSGTANTSKLAIDLIDVEASYKKDALQGINGTLHVAINSEEGTSELVLLPSALTARRADLGVTLENMASELELRGERLFAREVGMELLGGYARANEIALYLPEFDAAFVVEVEDLDLAQVLALEGEDITGSGSLRGTLPLELRKGEWSMSNGRLVADPPGGRIALSPEFGNATGQPGLDFAVQALTNFSYEKLAVEAEYAENGDLKLAVALQGRNPEVEKGRAIHYNLTINENLLALMESLRVQRVVTDKVEQQVNKKQK